MSRHRVLLATNIFPPAIGGPATFVDQMAERLSEDGAQVRIVCRVPAPDAQFDIGRPFKVIRMAQGRGVAGEIALRYRLLIEAARADLVFSNGLDYQVHLACKQLRKPYVLKIVGDAVWEASRNSGITSLDIDQFQTISRDPDSLPPVSQRRLSAVTGAARIITPSNYLNKMVVDWGVPKDRVITVYNGCPAAREPDPIPARADGEPLRIIYVGRLTNWKGVDAVLMAIRQMDGVELSIVGDGPEFPALSDLSFRLGVSDKVTFFGKLSHEATLAHLRQSHVLVLMSLYEGLSHTLLEAGAVGLACVASNRGGNPETITHEVDGLLIDPFDVDALAQSLASLRDDEPLRQRLGSALQQRVRADFDFEDTVTGAISALSPLPGQG